MNSEITMNKVCLPVIAIALGIIAFCALKNTFKPSRNSILSSSIYEGKKISYYVHGDYAEQGTIHRVDDHRIEILRKAKSGKGGERMMIYNLDDIVWIADPPESKK